MQTLFVPNSSILDHDFEMQKKEFFHASGEFFHHLVLISHEMSLEPQTIQNYGQKLVGWVKQHPQVYPKRGKFCIWVRLLVCFLPATLFGEPCVTSTHLWGCSSECKFDRASLWLARSNKKDEVKLGQRGGGARAGTRPGRARLQTTLSAGEGREPGTPNGIQPAFAGACMSW